MTNHVSSTLVFIDAAVQDYALLQNGVATDAKVVILRSDQDGIAQITAAICEHSPVCSIHLVSHGSPGRLYLGSTQLNLLTLPYYEKSVRQWAQWLTDNSDLLIYGCNVAAGELGERFVERLGALTGANVAASATLTGSAALGGDWSFSKYVGDVRSPQVFQPAALDAYPAVLAPNLLYAVTGTDIRDLDIATGASTSVGSLEFATFAIARDTATGRIYYVETEADGRVAYWDPATNTNVILPGTTGATTELLKLAQSASGQLFAIDGTTTNLYAINIDPAAPTGGRASIVGSITGNGFSSGSGDIAFDPTNPNRLFILTTGAGFYNLYTIDISAIDPTNPTATIPATLIGNAGLSDVASGSLAFGPDEQLYATSQNNLYRIDQTTAAPTLIGPTGFNFTDFATLATPTPVVDLQVTKTTANGQTSLTPGSPISYTITVTVPAGDENLQGITLADVIPAEITNVTWTAAISGTGSFQTPSSGSGNSINSIVNLNAGSSAVFTVNGVVSPSAAPGSVINNTATVTIPRGFNDPDSNNNTSTSSTSIQDVIGNNQPPATSNASAELEQGQTIRLTGLSATDPNGTISSFTILTVPSTQQGILFLGDPSSGGTPITGTRVLNPNQVNQLFFRASNRFSGATFTYTATDNQGAADPTPATVRLRLDDGETPPPAPPPPDDDGCQPGLRIRGTAAPDTLEGTPDSDRIIGLAGDDLLYGLACGDTLIGGQGRDRMYGGSQRDVLRGGNNSDFMNGGSGNDTLIGNVGREAMYGGTGRDVLKGGRGNDFLDGGANNDRILGNVGRDILRGRSGDDVLNGGKGRDRILGDSGSDILIGNLADDRLFGGSGRDQMNGGAGNDRLFGDNGRDNLSGQAGNDVLVGGTERDTLTGGNGADRFVYIGESQAIAFAQSTAAALDRITDFRFSQRDRIQLSFSNNLRQRNRPSGLFNAGEVSGGDLVAAATAAYGDKNQQVTGAQVLDRNEAVFFSWQDRTFLSVNAGSRSFNLQDLLVEVSGIEFRGGDELAGSLNVRSYFA